MAVETPASGFNDWERRVVHFHGFEALTTTKGESVASPEFACLGHKWRVSIFPCGFECSDDGMVFLGLCNRSKKSIEVGFDFNVKDSDGNNVAKYHERSRGSDLLN